MRRFLALVISFYAVAFAFGALAALRLPAVAAVSGFLEGSALHESFADVNWRHVSILLGGPYLLSAIAFFLSAGLVRGRRPGAVLSFILGALIGFPCVLFVEFHAAWWRAPTLIESCIATAAGCTLVILGLIHDVRPRQDRAGAVRKAVKTQRARSIAIARQRALYAAEGRKQRAKRRARIRWRL